MADRKLELLWMLNEERSDNASDLLGGYGSDAKDVSDRNAEAAASEKSEPLKIGAAILAAGGSDDTGEFRPLLQIGGISALERIIYTMKIAGVDEIAVVTGYQAEKIEPIIYREDIVAAHDDDFERGLHTDVRAAVRAMKACEMDGFFLIPADMPMIEIDTVKELIKKAEEILSDPEMSADLIAPVYMGKTGRPLFIPNAYYDEILSCDGGCSADDLMDKYRERLVRYPVESEGVVLDTGGQAGYQEVLDYYESGGQEESFSSLFEGHRFFLVRSGRSDRDEENIFLGQTDVPLSREGREGARKVGAEISDYQDLKVSHIYTSDLLRAEDTAEEIAGALDILDVRSLRALRERSFGEWDGRYISDVRSECPDEYEKMEGDVFGYSFGNGYESFYDLQYRVLKELKRILTDEAPGSDVVIVAHSGVLRVIVNALEGTGVSDDFDEIGNAEFAVIEK